MAALSPDDESNLLNEIAKIEEYESDKETDVVGEIENLLDETQKHDPQSFLLAPPPPPSPPPNDVPQPPDDLMLDSQVVRAPASCCMFISLTILSCA